MTLPTFLRLAGFLALVLAARGGELALTILAGPGPHAAGRRARIELVALNPGGQEDAFTVDAPLRGTLAAAGRRWAITLQPVEASPVAVPAGGFAVRRFEVALPDGCSGEAILTIERGSAPVLRTVLTVVSGPHVSSTADGTPPVERLVAATPAASAIVRNFSGRFLPNQPVYFVYGDSAQAAKFQFSFDYRLATLRRGDDPAAGISTLRLGYTQRSVWDLDGASSPFYDTSYLPEIAFCHDRPIPDKLSRVFTWLGWRAGLLHESNGREGLDSRSMNTVYVRPRFVLGTLGQWAFVMLPELHVYLGEASDNADINDYRGHGRLRFYFGHNAGPSLMFTGWAGKDLDHGTWQLDLAVPTRLRWLNLESYFHVQYFNGYGESLRDYRLRSDALRFGFSLIR